MSFWHAEKIPEQRSRQAGSNALSHELPVELDTYPSFPVNHQASQQGAGEVSDCEDGPSEVPLKQADAGVLESTEYEHQPQLVMLRHSTSVVADSQDRGEVEPRADPVRKRTNEDRLQNLESSHANRTESSLITQASKQRQSAWNLNDKSFNERNCKGVQATD